MKCIILPLEHSY